MLHLLAVAREAGVELDIDDFDRIAAATPTTCDLKPGGRFVAKDLYEAGGIAVVAKRLLDAGILHEGAQTVTGRTIGEHAREAAETPGQEVVRPLGDPVKKTGGLAILRGNLAPDGCVVKLAGHVAPEALAGGPIAAVRDGDTITIDVPNRRMDVELTDDEIARRVAEYESPPPAYSDGVLAKYARLVGSASEGAVTRA